MSVEASGEQSTVTLIMEELEKYPELLKTLGILLIGETESSEATYVQGVRHDIFGGGASKIAGPSYRKLVGPQRNQRI